MVKPDRRPAAQLAIAFATALAALAIVWAGRADAAQLTLSPTAATAEVRTEHTLTARVTGAGSDPVAGVRVLFLFPDCESASQLITDAAGEATCIFTRSFPGTQHISAAADLNRDSSASGEPSDSSIVEWVAGPATSLRIEPSRQVRVIDNEECVTAVPRDAGDQGVEGALVRFVASGANFATGTVRAGFFSARFCYTGLLAGEDRVSAYVDTDEDGVRSDSEPGATATKLWLAQRASLTVSPVQSSAPVGTEHRIEARVTTAAGAPLEGVPVRFTSFDRIFDDCGFIPDKITDSDGRASCVIRSEEPGTVNVRVQADVDNDGATTALVHHKWTSGDAVGIALQPSFAVHRVAKQTCVSVIDVDDAAGRPASDKLVRVAITGANPLTRTVRTTQFGNAFVCYAGTRAGDDAISAYVDNNENGVDDGSSEPQATATRIWVSLAPILTVTPASGSGPTGTEHALTATLTTADGAPIAGIPVTFRDRVPSANNVLCMEFFFSQPTDAQGKVTCTYKGRNAGTDEIAAAADLDNNVSFDSESAVGSATFTWLSGPADSLALEPRSSFGLTGARRCVSASVHSHPDDLGPVAVVDKPVRFTVSGANDAGGVVPTDRFGRAELCYTPTAAGADELTAFVDNDGDGVHDSDSEPGDSVAARWLAEAPEITLMPATSTGLIGSTHTLTATVRGANGEPVPGAVVWFEGDDGPNFTFCENDPSYLTDAEGRVVCSYRGDGVGTDDIRAFVDLNDNAFNDAGEPYASVTRTWTPSPAASLSLSPSHATRIAGRFGFNFACATADPRGSDGRFARGVPVVFAVTGANPGGGTRGGTFSGDARFCYEGRSAGADSILAYADNNGNGSRDAGEPSATADVLWLTGQPERAELAPASVVNPVGTVHTVGIDVSDADRPVTGVQIVFSVAGANRILPHGEETDERGHASFDYLAARAGTDTITAVVDMNGNSFQDADERVVTAASVWTSERPTSLRLDPQTAGGPFGSEHCVQAQALDRFARAQANRLVQVSVAGANAASGSGETLAGGSMRFCYTSVLPGTDLITAYVDTDRDRTRDPDEPQAQATRTVDGARLEVRSILAPAGDPGRFALQIDGVTVPGASAVGNGGSTGEIPLVIGSHTVGELAAAGTGLNAYSASIECRGTDGSGPVIAASAGFGPLSVPLGQGDDVVCTITNRRNRPPDCSSVAPSPSYLWPPNHQQHLVRLAGATDPDGDAVRITVTNVVQDEPLGRERVARLRSDALLSDGPQVFLRAERLGSGDGRIYLVRFTATDSRGGACRGAVSVAVPHSKGGWATDSGPPHHRSISK